MNVVFSSISMLNYKEKEDRQATAAGKFYPDNIQELRDTVDELFRMSTKAMKRKVQALILPHAGYVFSGKIAASGINQLPPNSIFDRIILLGSSHYEYFEGASVFTCGNFLIPGREIEVDKEFVTELCQNYPDLFYDNPHPHYPEHSLEVQLPLLERHLTNPFRIVPLLLGTHDPHVCARIAQALTSELNNRNLIIVSTDFSHYPSESDAIRIDHQTEEMIRTGNAEKLIDYLRKVQKEPVRGLQTSLCGWTSVLVLLNLAADRKDLEFITVDHGTSADASYYSDNHRVVGYRSIALVEKEKLIPDFNDREVLNEEEQKLLLEHARTCISGLFGQEQAGSTNKPDCFPILDAPMGAFVTIHNHGKLRGCYGRMYSDDSLWDTIQEMSIWSASRDSRFHPVEKNELDEIDLEVSVLSPLRRIENPDEIILGKHGILIRKEFHSGVFLPQVADETGWNLEEFLGHCARDKAHIGWEGWKTADIYVFTCQVFSEN